ncbi:ATP-binding protein [Desmospora activa]|uniref:ATP-binding protein n=1 Tax=Desmospora activa TaxID=500615 RepID=UPI001FE62559|nr:ATP-binding protein [Desmospora activa]
MKKPGDGGDRKVPIAFHLDVKLDHLTSWVEGMPQPALVLDDHGKVIEVSQSLLSQVGWERSSVLNQPFQRWLLLPEKGEHHLFHPGESKPKLLTLQGSLLSPDYSPLPSTIHWISGTSEGHGYHLLIFNPASRGWGLFHHRIDRLAADLQLGIIVLDGNGRVDELNRSAQMLIGVNRNDVLRRPVEHVFNHPIDETGKLSSLLEKIQNRIPFRDQPVSWVVGEKRLDVRLDYQPLGRWEDHIIGAYCLIRDMTQLQSLEMQVRRNDRLAMIGQIAAGTAHEIRNPLTSIRGFLQVMKHALQEKGELKEQGYTEIMLREIDRINNLLGEFLLLSKPRSVRMCPVQVDEIWKELLPIIENEAILHNTEVRFQVENPSLPRVKADKELLKQVFLNLCKNGIEAMGDGGILTIRLFAMTDRKELAIEVWDTGPGIPPHAAEKIFDPFFTTKEHGTGLGLSVCKRILQDIGGRVEFSSLEDGTAFTVHIPVMED